MDVHPDTAAKFGLQEGDWIYIESRKGRIKQKLSLDPDLDRRLVFASFGWYFPESSEGNYGYQQSNINVLTDIDPPYENMTGAIELGGIPCRIYRVEAGNNVISQQKMENARYEDYGKQYGDCRN